MKRVISIDWLTMYCHGSFINTNKYYNFVKQQGGSAQFAEIYKVYDVEFEEPYAIVQMKPYSPIIPADTMMVQICNRWLYREDWNIRFNNFCLSNNIKPMAISRIDICADFNTFDNNLHPQNFVNGFLTNKYLKTGQSKYTLMGEQTDKQRFSYLRFGKRDNEVSTYLYNKSKELKEVQNKPYIYERWENAGLDMTKDVWRLEVSMRTVQLRTILKMTGEIIRLDLPFLSTMGVVENVYNAAILKYFDFRINDGQAKKSRMKRLDLFKGMSSTLELKVMQDRPKTNRMDKIVIKKLANCYSQYRIEKEDEQDVIFEALNLIIDKCDLRDYFNVMVSPYIGKYKER